MALDEFVRSALAVVIGLLLGSVLPADLLARRRGVDIRSQGDGNPGTINAVRVLGWLPGLLTAVYDLSVGVLAIEIAGLLGVPTGIGYLAGIATIVGHRFPVFQGFRGGGQAMAASAGLLLYGLALALSYGWLTAADVAIFLAILLVTFAVTRSDSAAAVVMLPFLVVRLAQTSSDWQFVAFMWVVAAHIWTVQLPVARRWLASSAVGPTRHPTHE